ncbi:MAG: hypothetical protein HKN47_04390 [Pirellulaceae bacterium]|nr:hypothetical protein [Pirellulaceae bacterium]
MNQTIARVSAMFVKYSIRSALLITAIITVGVSQWERHVWPVQREMRVVDQLQVDGAEAVTVSVVPPALKQIVAPTALQRSRSIHLKTPWATVAFIDQLHQFEDVQRVVLVGSSVDAAAAATVLQRGVSDVQLDSTAVTDHELIELRHQYPNARIDRSFQWAVDCIDSVGRYPFGYVDDPLTIIRAVNHFRSLEKPLVIESLQQYAVTHNDFQQYKLRYLMPLVFERYGFDGLSETDDLCCACRPHHLIRFDSLNELLDLLEEDATERGEYDRLLGTVLQRMQRSANEPPPRCFLRRSYGARDDLYLVGDIPFSIDGYEGRGCSVTSPRSTEFLIRCAQKHGRLINVPLVPTGNPSDLSDQVLQQFSQRTSATDRRMCVAKQQIEAAIDGLVGHLPAGAIRRDLHWDSVRQVYRPQR